MKKVFILCAGSAVRFGGVCKQLLPITRNGKCVLDRILWQLHSRNEWDVHIVTHNPEIIQYAKNRDVGIVYPEVYDLTPHTALSTKEWWGDENLILVGDGVYSNNTFSSIVSIKQNICFIGDIYEICAVSFTDKDIASHVFDIPFCVGRYAKAILSNTCQSRLSGRTTAQTTARKSILSKH